MTHTTVTYAPEVDTKILAQAAASLVVAVNDRDHVEVGQILAGLSLRQLRSLCVRLAGHVNVDKPLQVSPMSRERVIEASITHAADAFGVSAIAIKSSSRRRDHIDARHVAAYAARLSGAPYTSIGEAMNRDHSTIMNAVGRVAELPRLRGIAHQIATKIGGSFDDALLDGQVA